MGESTPKEYIEERDERGKMLAPLPGTQPITHATARSMAALRWEKARKSAANRIMREAASIDPTVSTWYEAWGILAAKQYLALMDSDKPRGDDLYRIGQVMGALPTSLEARAMEQQAPASAGQVVPADIARGLIELLRQLAGRDVVDGVVSDAE